MPERLHPGENRPIVDDWQHGGSRSTKNFAEDDDGLTVVAQPRLGYTEGKIPQHPVDVTSQEVIETLNVLVND